MRIIADLHIHSKYAYATSKFMDLDDITRWAKIKGVGLLGTGDFTHPLWRQELKKKLKPLGRGTFAYNGIRFFLNGEVSNIYRKSGRTYKIHNLLFVPGFRELERLVRQFSKYGKLSSDGRPILKLDCEDLMQMVKDESEDCFLIPSHAWTPHFGLLGSRSGFDSIAECFGRHTGEIFAIETGLSSDPAMNWRLSRLDGITLISNSDAHSSANIGREANVFEVDNDTDLYAAVFAILKNKDRRRFCYTIEYFPEEGKYHYDGHRLCQVRMAPADALRHHNRCPVCGKQLTIGVLHRVEALADRPEGTVPGGAIPFKKLLPLDQVIAAAFKKGKQTAVVEKEYFKLVNAYGSELQVLLDVSYKEINRIADPQVAVNIQKMREENVEIQPGFDGEYGSVRFI